MHYEAIPPAGSAIVLEGACSSATGAAPHLVLHRGGGGRVGTFAVGTMCGDISYTVLSNNLVFISLVATRILLALLYVRAAIQHLSLQLGPC